MQSHDDQVKLRADVNGETVADWEGPLAALSVSHEPNTLRLNTWSPKLRVDEFSLQITDGEFRRIDVTAYDIAAARAAQQALRCRAELLTLVDPAQDALAGPWKRTDQGLTVDAGETAASGYKFPSSRKGLTRSKDGSTRPPTATNGHWDSSYRSTTEA